MRGIFPKQNTSAHALRQGEQFLKKSFFKQNGTSGKGRRVVTDPESQTEDLPFCFFLPFQPSSLIPPGDACHGFHCLAAQKRLVSRQEHAAKKLWNLFQQRGKSQPHRIVRPGRSCSSTGTLRERQSCATSSERVTTMRAESFGVSVAANARHSIGSPQNGARSLLEPKRWLRPDAMMTQPTGRSSFI